MSGREQPVLRVRAGAATDAGAVRERNEDAFVVSGPVYAVADGMGGHTGGAEASAIVADELSSITSTPWVTAAGVHASIARAARRVADLADGEGRAPGSTLSGVGLAQQDGMPCWLVFNVGDSRTYRLQNGAIELITVDHTRVQELVDAGRITADEARTHAQRNVITRAIGAGSGGTPHVDLSLLVAGPDDRLLICSDGLTGELTEQLIAALLLDIADPSAAAEALVREAVTAGGRDNVTAVVVDVVDLTSSAHDADSDDTRPDLQAVPEEGHGTLPDAVLAGTEAPS
ncbi:protein phosphatase 2C domain-containing protein [Nocardioides KLBMP 9356]|uniref:Protein phosphatase 2C domain-containing protein n=1 Tax=Nocardioides potassii TaxID=2911371 RepID=A0ABS9HE34_9ACTN|nr:protein phosphatase 2C domain-containing protein [Nocardioides potassii]MCF6378469.1 protein phosphatase 2C domain-containing protein [Nocardioides potassii]